MSKTIIESIYREDWYLHDGPPDHLKFKEALDHPQFKRIDFDIDRWGDDIDSIYISVEIERPETEEEKEIREKKSRTASRAAKQAAKTREQNRLKKEREDYERLKKKFEQ